jgi:hypothetical protein
VLSAGEQAGFHALQRQFGYVERYPEHYGLNARRGREPGGMRQPAASEACVQFERY